MTRTVRAKYDGRVFVPQEPVDLPVDQVLTLHVEQADQPVSQPLNALQRLARNLQRHPIDPDAPEDLSAQHDHYLYGTPKRIDE